MTSDAPATASSISRRDRLGPVGKGIFNLFFWPYLFGSLPVYFCGALAIFVPTFIVDRRRRLLRWYTNWWASHYLAWSPFAGVTVVGGERVPDASCVFISNHQSMVDVLAVSAVQLNALWVSKIENFFVPFIGWNMALCGDIKLRRGHLPSILRMIRDCDARLKDGHSLLVFPEGTRSPNGEIQDFYRGAFWMAARNGVPIVPILLEGTNHVLPKRSFAISPQRCVAHVLPPMHPADYGNDDRRFRDAVREKMIEAQREVRARLDETPPDDPGSA